MLRQPEHLSLKGIRMKVCRSFSQPMLNCLVSICVQVFASTLSPAADDVTDVPNYQATPDVEWDAVFSRTEGWTGGDVAGTVDLGDGRTVWVFGDSWIGKVSHGRHASGSHMINNAIAIQRHSSLGKERAPTYDGIEFFWGPANTTRKPTAWIVPDIAPDTHWYWPTGGGIVVPGTNGKRRLVLFLFHLTKRGEKDSAWNFKHVGSAMAIVDNPGEPADKWKVRQMAIPYTVGTADSDREGPTRNTNWGVGALLKTERRKNVLMTYLYVYGIYNAHRLNKHLMLARVPVTEIERLSQWQFYAGDGRWSSRMRDAVHIAEKMASELSIDEYVDSGRRKYLMVHSEPAFGRRILVRTAPMPEGQWSSPTPVYTVPGLDRGKDYFTYAAKGHLHLSRKSELLVTYIINANNIWDMAVDAAIYRPRFVRVPMAENLRSLSGSH